MAFLVPVLYAAIATAGYGAAGYVLTATVGEQVLRLASGEEVVVDDGVRQALADMGEGAVNMAYDAAPETTQAVFNALEATADAGNTVLIYVDDKTGNHVSGTWNELSPETKVRLKAGGALVGMIAAPALASGVRKVVPNIKLSKIRTNTKTSAGLSNLPKNYFGQDRKFWSSDPIEFNGNKVYQRNDLFDLNQVDDLNRTNLQRMREGLAPEDFTGKSIELHHMLQIHDGPIAEVTKSFHSTNTKILHINPNTIPSGINRNAFNSWRNKYWKNRAKDFE